MPLAAESTPTARLYFSLPGVTHYLFYYLRPSDLEIVNGNNSNQDVVNILFNIRILYVQNETYTHNRDLIEVKSYFSSISSQFH